MTRTRINIDVNDHLLAWINLTATVVGATRTETARALLELMSDSNPRYDAVKKQIEDHRARSNQSRRLHQIARHHPPQQ